MTFPSFSVNFFLQGHKIPIIKVFNFLSQACFQFWVAIVNEIVSLYFSVCFLLVYRKVVGLCVLILYLVTWLKLIIFKSAFCGVFGVSYIESSSANGDTLLSFPVCIPFIPFSYHAVLTMTKRVWTPLPYSCSQWELFWGFSPLSMMLALGMLYLACIILGNAPSISCLSMTCH